MAPDIPRTKFNCESRSIRDRPRAIGVRIVHLVRERTKQRDQKSRVPAIALALLIPAIAVAQRPAADSVRTAVRAYVRAYDADILHEFSDFLTIPNVATDSANIRRNAAAIVAMLQKRGATARLLEPRGAGSPAVYGEIMTPGATKTVVLYAHYDGQPVEPAQWATPPWAPTLRDKPLSDGGQVIPIPQRNGATQGEWRLYARAAADDKATIMAILAALDALRAVQVRPSVRLKLFFEGEEEAGSPHLAELLTSNAALLQADAWLFGDGPVHQSRRQQIVFGARGVMGAELTTYGPIRALHSGHYGNWAPNPVTLLAGLIASMRNDDGRILIPHFYDDVDPITAADRRALASLPPVDSALRAELQLGGTEAHNAPLGERIMRPALNLRGFHGGAVGETAANAIPTEARASIDFRLVPHQTPRHVRQLVEAHARSRGYYIIDHDPTPAERMRHGRILKIQWDSGYAAVRTAVGAPLARAVVQAGEMALGEPVIQLPILGGSLPLSIFAEALHTPLVVVPIANHDNNQHAANENLRLQNLWDGIALYAGLMAELGTIWKASVVP